MFKNLNILFLILLASLKLFSTRLQYPPIDNIATYKPISISPTGSICGLELKDTLCDNRYLDDKACANKSLLFNCDQACPYGNVLQSLTDLDQIKLENMNPCVIFKDFNYLLASKTSSKYSYYFDKSNNLCSSLSNRVLIWRPLTFESHRSKPLISFYNSRTSSLSILDSGFTVSLWFTQSSLNNGLFFLI